MKHALRRFGSMLLSMATLVTLSTVVLLTSASSASAADNRCLDKYGSSWNAGSRPQWLGAVQATKANGVRTVAEVAGPSTQDGGRVVIWENRNETPQLWCFSKEGAVGSYSYYRIRNLYTGKCMDIQGPWKGNGVRVHQWNCSGFIDRSSQQWILIAHGTKWLEGSYKTVYEWQNRFNGGSLDVNNYLTANGSYTQVWQFANTENQLWY